MSYAAATNPLGFWLSMKSSAAPWLGVDRLIGGFRVILPRGGTHLAAATGWGIGRLAGRPAHAGAPARRAGRRTCHHRVGKHDLGHQALARSRHGRPRPPTGRTVGLVDCPRDLRTLPWPRASPSISRMKDMLAPFREVLRHPKQRRGPVAPRCVGSWAPGPNRRPRGVPTCSRWTRRRQQRPARTRRRCRAPHACSAALPVIAGDASYLRGQPPRRACGRGSVVACTRAQRIRALRPVIRPSRTGC